MRMIQSSSRRVTSSSGRDERRGTIGQWLRNDSVVIVAASSASAASSGSLGVQSSEAIILKLLLRRHSVTLDGSSCGRVEQLHLIRIQRLAKM